MGIHDGHRDRIRSRFLEQGLDGYTSVQVLEFLLFYAIPRRDTNVIAHALMERFGSLSRVLEASESELMEVEGISSNAAVFLKLIPAAGRFYLADKTAQMKKLSTLEECAEYLRPRFFGRSNEIVCLLCLDAKCAVICCCTLSEGDVASAGLSVRKVAETALRTQAVSVVLAHNHPGGNAFPSQEDLAVTASVSAALNAMGIVLADHMIFTEENYYSMAMHGGL